MAKVSAKDIPLVCARWPAWLRRALDGAGISQGRLARELRTKGRSSEPHSAIREMLAGQRAPTPATVFNIGQALARASVPEGEEYVPLPGGHLWLPKYELGKPVAPGGLIALHAAGYYRDAAAVALLMLRSERADDRVYASRFAAVVWIAHADLDQLDEVSPRDRQEMSIFIGDAPIDAIKEAWNRRSKLDRLSRALLVLGEVELLPGLAHVAMWSALLDTIKLRSFTDPALAQWPNIVANGFARWKEVVLKRHAAASNAASH